MTDSRPLTWQRRGLPTSQVEIVNKKNMATGKSVSKTQI